MSKFLTKQDIIEKLQSLPDLPIVVMNDSHSGTLDKVASVEVVKAIRYDPVRSDVYALCDDSYEDFTHKVILIS
jgi:hypothetical protein